MKTLIASSLILATFATTQASADSWTWAPISNGTTLDAHLARCDFARPNPMLIFDLISDLHDKTAASQNQEDDTHS